MGEESQRERERANVEEEEIIQGKCHCLKLIYNQQTFALIKEMNYTNITRVVWHMRVH